jgi:flagellin
MNSESGMMSAISESMSLAKSSISTARLGAETLTDLAQQFVDRVAFAQEEGVDRAAVGEELQSLVEQMATTITQSTFNGENLISTAGVGALTANTKTVVTGIARTGTGIVTTSQGFSMVDLQAIVGDPTAGTAGDGTLSAIAAAVATDTFTTDAATTLAAAVEDLQAITTQATNLGVAEKAIETQQEFLSALTDRIDAGVGAMVDADMEEEAARLQALQVQQQLATQSLSIANQGPQNILSLFR